MVHAGVVSGSGQTCGEHRTNAHDGYCQQGIEWWDFFNFRVILTKFYMDVVLIL